MLIQNCFRALLVLLPALVACWALYWVLLQKGGDSRLIAERGGTPEKGRKEEAKTAEARQKLVVASNKVDTEASSGEEEEESPFPLSALKQGTRIKDQLQARNQVNPIDMPSFVISTAQGNIVVRMREDAAPMHCKFMQALIQAGKYDGAVFYRAEKNFVLQGGLQDINGKKREAGIANPPLEVKLLNKRGTVTMARWEDPNSGSGEFFINLADSAHLDKTSDHGWGLGFTVFGEVVSGLEIADQISNFPTKESGGMKMLNPPIAMQKVYMQ